MRGDLYALPAFRDTTKFDQIKRHYYTTHPQLNPSRIVPDGPLLDWSALRPRAPVRTLTARCARGREVT